MTTQVWNFVGIESGASDIRASVTKTQALLDEGTKSLTVLAAVWGGNGSEAYQAVQRQWHEAAEDLNNSLQNLASRIGEAGQAMATTESRITGMFV